MTATKNPTQWRPPSGTGYMVNIGELNLVDNLQNLLVTNSQEQLVTTPTYITPRNNTEWTETGA